MELTPSAQAAALWIGLSLILMLVLSMLAVRSRASHKVTFGDEGIPELAQALRAFGNAAEYIPAGCVALLALALVQAGPVAVHIAGFCLFAGRAIHAVGLSRSGGLSLPRAVGMILTWISYVFAGAALVFYSF